MFASRKRYDTLYAVSSQLSDASHATPAGPLTGSYACTRERRDAAANRRLGRELGRDGARGSTPRASSAWAEDKDAKDSGIAQMDQELEEMERRLRQQYEMDTIATAFCGLCVYCIHVSVNVVRHYVVYVS